MPTCLMTAPKNYTPGSYRSSENELEIQDWLS